MKGRDTALLCILIAACLMWVGALMHNYYEQPEVLTCELMLPKHNQ